MQASKSNALSPLKTFRIPKERKIETGYSLFALSLFNISAKRSFLSRRLNALVKNIFLESQKPQISDELVKGEEHTLHLKEGLEFREVRTQLLQIPIRKEKKSFLSQTPQCKGKKKSKSRKKIKYPIK